jgi:enamine deaminase RidA (YjgF/YER057c/UK114 family)
MVSSAETRLEASGIELPPAPAPFGNDVPGLQTGNFLFLTGMLPTVGHEPKFLGRTGGFSDHLTVADAASELFRDILGRDKISSRLMFGVESLPLYLPVELEVILEVSA